MMLDNPPRHATMILVTVGNNIRNHEQGSQNAKFPEASSAIPYTHAQAQLGPATVASCDA